MDEIDELRLKKMQEQQQRELNDSVKLQQQVMYLENLVRPYLSKEALTRYYNLKSAHQEIAIQALALLTEQIQYGNIKGKITDEQFKNFLMQIQPSKREFKFLRK